MILDAAHAEAQEKRLAAFFEGEVTPASVQGHLQRAMWDCAGIRRDETGLRTALRAAEDLLGARLKAASGRNLLQCCAVQNLCTTADAHYAFSPFCTRKTGWHLAGRTSSRYGEHIVRQSESSP